MNKYLKFVLGIISGVPDFLSNAMMSLLSGRNPMVRFIRLVTSHFVVISVTPIIIITYYGLQALSDSGYLATFHDFVANQFDIFISIAKNCYGKMSDWRNYKRCVDHVMSGF